MKNTTKTIAIVLAVFLVAALFIGAASAAQITRTVAAGNDTFVYEKIQITNSDFGNTLYKMSGDATPVVLNTIAGSNQIFDLLEASVGTYTGVYYNSTDVKNASSINVWYPQMSLKAYLGGTYDTIDGKTINKGTKLEFIVEAPKVGPVANGVGDATALQTAAKIYFTTPVGGKTTQLNSSEPGLFDAMNFEKKVEVKNTTTVPQDAVAGTYVAQAEFTNADNAFAAIPDKYKKSNTISFTIQSDSLTITANKDSVVRSNPFTVVVQGTAKTSYQVFIDGFDKKDLPPYVLPGQNGVTFDGLHVIQTYTVDTTTYNSSANITTDASGKRTVQYNTLSKTEDKTYTIKVEKTTDSTDYDKVKVKVEKGAVTITASGDRSYYIGAEIKFTGTNTDSSDIYLFVTGPNLKYQDGVILKDLATQNPAYNATSSSIVNVKTDNTWEYKWDTSECGLDTGAYTIYATSVLTNGKASGEQTLTASGKTAVKLSDAEYATVSVNLKQPFLSAVPSGTTVAKGDKIYIRGTAEGEPSSLTLYIFGPNKYLTETVTVEDDGSYEKKLDIGSDWSSNQYYVVIEHPMYNGVIDVHEVQNAAKTSTYLFVPNAENLTQSTYSSADIANSQASFIVDGNGKLQGSNAADALTKMIDSANIDDIYTKLTFTVQEAWIKINNPGDQAAGTTFTISGTTNLAVDDQILIEVVSSSFNAIDKTSTSTTSGFSQTTKVVAGDGVDNAWSIEVDSTNFKLDEYTIKANGIETDVTTTTNFNIVEKVTPTTVTTAPTGTSAPATTTPTATPTEAKTPGFGAFIALAGLGAVALLVLRRN